MSAPCRLCGVATSGPTTRRYTYSITGRPTPHLDYDVGTCDACLTLRPDETIGLALRAAARVLGVPEDDEHFREALEEEDDDVFDGLLYDTRSDPFGRRARTPQRKAWKHVSSETRARLKQARVRSLDAKVHAATGPARPVPETAPPGGPPACLACGVGKSVEWFSVTTGALTKGPDIITGCVCGTCAVVLRDVGAVGPSFIERACLEAQGLSWSDKIAVPGLRAWIATGREPGEPWEWVRVHEAPPDLDPLTQMRFDLDDLRREVTALRAEAGR